MSSIKINQTEKSKKKSDTANLMNDLSNKYETNHFHNKTVNENKTNSKTYIITNNIPHNGITHQNSFKNVQFNPEERKFFISFNT